MFILEISEQTSSVSFEIFLPRVYLDMAITSGYITKKYGFHNSPKICQASCVLKMAKFKAFHEMPGK